MGWQDPRGTTYRFQATSRRAATYRDAHAVGWLLAVGHGPGRYANRAVDEYVENENILKATIVVDPPARAPSSDDSPVVRGSYLIWSNFRVLYRRDLTTGQTVVVATDAVNTGNQLLANGDVIFGAFNDLDYQIKRYRAGVVQPLTEGTVGSGEHSGLVRYHEGDH